MPDHWLLSLLSSPVIDTCWLLLARRRWLRSARVSVGLSAAINNNQAPHINCWPKCQYWWPSPWVRTCSLGWWRGPLAPAASPMDRPDQSNSRNFGQQSVRRAYSLCARVHVRDGASRLWWSQDGPQPRRGTRGAQLSCAMVSVNPVWCHWVRHGPRYLATIDFQNIILSNTR